MEHALLEKMTYELLSRLPVMKSKSQPINTNISRLKRAFNMFKAENKSMKEVRFDNYAAALPRKP